MKCMTRIWMVSGLVGSSVFVFGEEAKVKGEEGTEKQPWSEYRVHDASRPQPPKVKTAGAVVILPPSDAKVLFDGTSLDAWQKGDGSEANWVIKDDVMIDTANDIQTKDEFGAIQLHCEWRVPADRKVDGQSGGNGGIFFMGLYEVQVMESETNLTYPDGQAAGLYGQKPPLVNSSLPQGEWQSYDITFVPPVYTDEGMQEPARISIFHNGVVVQNAEAYMGPTQYRQLASYPDTHPETGPIRLQYHGDPIEFRNMWVRPLGERP